MQDKERERRERVEQAQREADKHNAKLLPETPGYVRVDGPRRQYRAEVDSQGRKTFVEI